jgi:PAS domain S-box-containing protein
LHPNQGSRYSSSQEWRASGKTKLGRVFQEGSIRLFHGLHFKIASGVIATVVVVSMLYFVWDYRFARRQLLAELEQSTSNLSDVTLQGLLEIAMMGRHPELLQPMIERLGTDPSVLRIFVLDLSGEVRFSSTRSDLGRRFSFEDGGCRDCHAPENSHPRRSIFLRPAGEELLRNVAPLPNKEECHSCHDPSQRFNGVLVVDVPTARMGAQLRAHLKEMLISAGLAMLAILSVLGLLMNKLVILRLKKLTHATALLAPEQEDPELQSLEGRDEIGQLAQSFNGMAFRVRSSIQELQSQKAYLQDLINSLDDALVVVDQDLRVELTNRSASRTWDVKQLSALFLKENPLPAARQAVQRTFQTGEITRSQMSLNGSGQACVFEICSSPVRNPDGEIKRVIVLFQDVTQRKLFEKQISRAERLASVGQLAAGLVHEINNPMAAIATCVEGLERHLKTAHDIGTAQKEEIKDYLSTIGKASSRCAHITQRLLSASIERGEMELQQIDLTEIVHQVISLVAYEAEHRDIQITTNFGPYPVMPGDPEKLSQLFLNLILNSLEATRQNGHIHISVARENGSIKVQVIDDGCGIPEEDLEHIFDPFFTTRKEGRGTGLGLSMCEGVVRQHQGQIYVRSKQDEETRFTVLFPCREGSG